MHPYSGGWPTSQQRLRWCLVARQTPPGCAKMPLWRIESAREPPSRPMYTSRRRPSEAPGKPPSMRRRCYKGVDGGPNGPRRPDAALDADKPAKECCETCCSFKVTARQRPSGRVELGVLRCVLQLLLVAAVALPRCAVGVLQQCVGELRQANALAVEPHLARLLAHHGILRVKDLLAADSTRVLGLSHARQAESLHSVHPSPREMRCCHSRCAGFRNTCQSELSGQLEPGCPPVRACSSRERALHLGAAHSLPLTYVVLTRRRSSCLL